MARQVIGVGIFEDDKTGDKVRDAFIKVNNMTNEIYTVLGNGTILNAAVAYSGTPVNNQLAAWVNSSTIEGDTNLTWDGDNLSIGLGGVNADLTWWIGAPSHGLEIQGITENYAIMKLTGHAGVGGHELWMVSPSNGDEDAYFWLRNEDPGGFLFGQGASSWMGYIQPVSTGTTLTYSYSIITRDHGDARYLQLTGGTLTGNLTVPALTATAQIQAFFNGNNAIAFERNAIEWAIGALSLGEAFAVRQSDVIAGRFEPAGTSSPNATSIITREKGDARYSPLRPEIAAVTASRNLALTDERDILEVDTALGAVALTIPPEVTTDFPIGATIEVTLIDATAAATLVAGAAVTLNGVVTGTGTITNTAFSHITLYKRGADDWVVYGDIGAVA